MILTFATQILTKSTILRSRSFPVVEIPVSPKTVGNVAIIEQYGNEYEIDLWDREIWRCSSRDRPSRISETHALLTNIPYRPVFSVTDPKNNLSPLTFPESTTYKPTRFHLFSIAHFPPGKSNR